MEYGIVSSEFSPINPLVCKIILRLLNDPFVGNIVEDLKEYKSKKQLLLIRWSAKLSFNLEIIKNLCFCSILGNYFPIMKNLM